MTPVKEGYFNAGFSFEAQAVNSGGDSIQPALPFTLTIHYGDPISSETTLALYYWDEISAGWVQEPTSVVDPVSHTITATLEQWSRWVVLGKVIPTYMPVLFR
jgi:secreted protein with Ig-like and vWFA domain